MCKGVIPSLVSALTSAPLFNNKSTTWIQVDLGTLTKPIRRIRIWNRADGDSAVTGRIVGAFVELFVNGNVVWSAPITADQVVYQWNVPNYYF